jgi:hypothetical protein
MIGDPLAVTFWSGFHILTTIYILILIHISTAVNTNPRESAEEKPGGPSVLCP